MDRNEFIIAVMVLLFGSYVLGFLTHWIVTRLSRVSDAEMSQLDEMAEELHQAEEQRDAAKAERHQLEIQARSELGELRSDLATAHDALRSARAEVEDLRRLIDTHNSRQA